MGSFTFLWIIAFEIWPIQNLIYNRPNHLSGVVSLKVFYAILSISAVIQYVTCIFEIFRFFSKMSGFEWNKRFYTLNFIFLKVHVVGLGCNLHTAWQLNCRWSAIYQTYGTDINSQLKLAWKVYFWGVFLVIGSCFDKRKNWCVAAVIWR